MPEHEPQVGQAERSYSATSSSVKLSSAANHGINQVNRVFIATDFHFTRFHRPTRDEHHRNIQAHRRHQHARSDFVTV